MWSLCLCVEYQELSVASEALIRAAHSLYGQVTYEPGHLIGVTAVLSKMPSNVSAGELFANLI